ncbi:protein mono-ADP-ribosyltransferase PARP14 [Coregonus clupeaformis]|uniref:protein mono-ADP-ribosyltransferase PARP14 n=1 Tax=Coregonus clupeaformis TaxID=59861 RepID=UPI001E1C6839|nr:protein mono-ADP-ribosyltransferase PARP14 [Coregonus clupeaformis]
MTEKTLVLEGLPDDLDKIRPKLDLHFKNKRKSGGETLQIQDYPGDKRKALLVYHEDAVLQKVLDRKCHKIDFKIPFGLVELQVKLKEDGGETEVKKVKPPVFPRPTKDKLISLGKSSPNIEEKQASESLADSVTDDDIRLLLVRTTKECEKELLNLYFEQFASEEGVSITRHGKNSWILQLSCQSDAEKVLAKKEHQYGISVEVYNETAVEGKLDNRRFVLTGFSETCKCDIVSLFIGSCSQGADHAWEALDDGERVVVTFKQDIDINSFLRKCLSKKFQGMEIGACRLELTDSVLVQGDMRQIKGGVEEALNLYFSSRRSRGGDIKSQIWVTKGKSVVITFEDCHVAHQVAEHKHHFGGVDLLAQLFYPSLQKALTGQTALLPDIPTKVTLPLSTELLDFINCDETRKQEITTVLRRVHASVSFNTTTEPPQMELDMTMGNESLGMLRLFPTWERKARREALALLEKYKEVQLPIEVEVWERIESSCLGLKSHGASISYRSTSAEIVVVCVQNEVKTLVEKIAHMVKKARDELERERNTVLRKIPLDSKEELDLICDLVSGKLVDVGFSKDEESFIICLKGLENQVSTAEGAVKEALGNVEAKLLDISMPLMEFLKSVDLKKFEKNHFAQNNISSVFLLGDDSIQILAKRTDIQRAEDKLHEVIKEEVIKLTPDQTHVTKGEQWLQFCAGLNGELKSTKNNHNVSISVSQEKIGVCGFSSVVADVSGKLRGYLNNKKPETADVPLKSVQEVQYVATCMNLSEVPEIKALGVTILPCKTQGSPCLKITAASDKIKEALEAVKQRVSTITTEKYTFSEAGKSKVLEKNQVALQAKAKDLGCKLYLSPLITHCQKYSYDIEGCVTLTVGQGNISQHAADALICPMSSSLTFDTPIAKQFLQMGGPGIRKVCDKFLKERQTLQAGDVVLSNPGTLGAQHLIYAGIPVWGKASTPLNTVYLQSAVRDSLLGAENKKCVSIGMPVMGCGAFGFPVKESCVAIIKGILDFIYADQKPPQLRSIFVIDSDAKIVGEFQSAIEGKGYCRQQKNSKPATGTTPTAHSAATASHNTPPPPPLAAKPGSDIKVIIGGVSVILKKGDITKETVDIIVNSNNQNLNLNSGVSGAILKAAGESVADECKIIGMLKADGVVLTRGGDLNCKNIAQMVGPKNSADITTSIEKVFQLCESQKAATVSIPTIGTGQCGIEPKDSIKAILKGLESHMSQMPSSSIKIIFIVAFEQKIFDSLRNYFKKSNLRPHKIKQAASTPSQYSLPPNQVKIHGVRIELRKGDITQETVRGIVNTTNADISLIGGVSAAIVKAAGSAVEQECKTICPLRADAAGVTSGGALQCDFILHILGPHSVADATLRVAKVLECCEDKQITTVSFPAVGTGGGGLSGTDSIGAILQGIQDHLSLYSSSTIIKLIYIVVYEEKILQEFQLGLNQWKTSQMVEDDSDDDLEDDLHGDEDDSDMGDTNSVEEDDTSVQTGNTIEAIIGPVKVRVVCGDITKEKTDAIVSSTNSSLDLNSGVSGAILKAAGQTVVDECKALGTQPSDGVVMTTAGNLKTKHIIHMVGQTKEKEITSSMLKVLKMCEDKKIQSVSFPALGTGAGNLGAVQVGNAMIAAIADLLISIKTPSVTMIQIVIFQAKMINDFEEVMKKFKKVIPKPADKKSSRTRTAKTTRPTQPTPTRPGLCLASATATVVFPSMEVVVYGPSPASLTKVKKLLDELISEECISQDVPSCHLPLLLEAQKEAIVALSQKNQVCVLVASPDKMTVSGKKDDVLSAVLQIKDYLQGARDRESREGEEKRLRETVRWEAGEGETWGELDCSLSYDLELAFHRKENSFKYNHQGETFTVDLKDMQQTDSKGTITRVKRSLVADSDTAVIQFPQSWTRMEGKDLEIVTLAPNSGEYQRIEKEFIATSKNPNTTTQPTIQIVQIQRIQSKDQWQRYAVKKQAMDKKYPKNKNELNLYHGTTEDICQKINTCGFNRSFCGRNATVYGDGTYFAKEMWYSCHDAYSKPDASGLKYMYRARVLVGTPCLGVQGMKEPTPLNPADLRQGLHDCAVNDLQNPFIYVVFCDAGVYPDYLISFKTV